MHTKLGAMATAAMLGISAAGIAGIPDDCEYQFNHPVFGWGTQYRWVGTLDGTCSNIAIEVPDVFHTGGPLDFYLNDIHFTRVDVYDPQNPIGPSVWDVDVYLRGVVGGFDGFTIYARRPDVSINRITVHPDANGDAVYLHFGDADTPNGIYGFDLVKVIEREPNDENNDLSELDVTGVIPGYLGVSGQEALSEVTRLGSDKVIGFDSFTVGTDVFGDLTLELGRQSLFEHPNGPSQLRWLIVEGDLLGDVTVGSGAIDFLDVNGALGSPFAPVAVKTRQHIERIRSGAVYADILPGNVGGQKSYLKFLETTASNGENGDFIGTIDASQIGTGSSSSLDGLNIRGNFGGAATPSIVKVEEPLGLIEKQIVVRVGGSILSPTSTGPDTYTKFELPVQGLVGRMIINAENDGGFWDSDAKIEVATGGVPWVLDQAEYNLTRSQVGGGVVGLAPFVEYKRDSTGIPGGPGIVVREIPELCSGDPTGLPDPIECPCEDFNPPMYLRFYGGVEQAFTAGGPPVKIMSNEDGGSMVDITDRFTFDFLTEGGTGGRGYLRITKTTGTWDSASIYTISHDETLSVQSGTVEGGLRCQSVLGTPRSESFSFNINLVDNCKETLLGMFNMNGDDELCMGDMAYWLNEPSDIDSSGQVDETDAQLMLQAIDRFSNLD